MRTRDEQKEKLVIEKAIEQIVQDGFQGFSMNKLAKACGISVATLYIYYTHKDNLIQQIGKEVGRNFFETTMQGFSSDMDFETGLWIQWENRSAFALKYPKEVAFFEIIKHSPHGDAIQQELQTVFKQRMSDFFTNAIQNNQLIPLPVDVFWSIAYGPLHNLLRFHREGKNMAGMPFTLTDEIKRQAFQLVIKALKP